MEATATRGVLRFFSDLADPRTGHYIPHKLADMIVISILAVICGADGWTQVALWGHCKRKWLSTFLDLDNGIPSHDTFGRVFSLLDPDTFERCFVAWMASVVELSAGRLVAIDGKAIRRSFEHGWDKSGMAHLVSAFVCEGENKLVFAQAAVETKENEIVAIAKLLELLDLTGAVVTIDAMGCQREVAGKIIAGGSDYLLAVKANQPMLLAKTTTLMQDLALDHAKGTSDKVDYFEQSESGHGRIETRRVWATADVQWLGRELLDKWPGLSSAAMIERKRQNLGDFTGKVSVERQLYICSFKHANARKIADYARGHWAVENNLHWQLDVTFSEDGHRTRKRHGAENYSRIARIALNLLKQDKTLKASIKSKRLNAGWDHDYLLQLINQ